MTVDLHYPFRGRWMALNSPASRVPSHGTELFGSAYAIDLVGVDERGRSAPYGWSAAVSTEAPQRFAGFGRPILAPVAGRVVIAHDGEPDHVARRSVPMALPYLLTQQRRLRKGIPAIVGNHIVIEVARGGPYVLLAHLQRGSIHAGDQVEVGDAIARCGNSGNSTQPHVHLQATESLRWVTAVGLPIRFIVPGQTTNLPRNKEIVDV